MKHVPNILSFLRLILCPVFIWAFFSVSPEIAFVIFAVASILDVLDGYIARKYQCISSLGKIIDPVADKTLQGSALVCFLIKGSLPWWMLAFTALKEVLTLVGGAIASKKLGSVVISNYLGKFSSFFVTFTMCLLFFIDGVLSPLKSYMYIFFIVSLVLSYTAFVSYTVIALKQLKNKDKSE